MREAEDDEVEDAAKGGYQRQATLMSPHGDAPPRKEMTLPEDLSKTSDVPESR